jgi:hypothetical protein
MSKFSSEERKRKLALALTILGSSESDDSSDEEIFQMFMKERMLRPKHKKRRSLMNFYAEDDV